MNIKVVAIIASEKSIDTCMYVYPTVSFITIIVLSLLLRLPVNNSGMIMISISNPQTETKTKINYTFIYVYPMVSFITTTVLPLLLLLPKPLPLKSSGIIMISISNPQTETQIKTSRMLTCPEKWIYQTSEV